MSFANNSTEKLWSSFMPHRKEVKNSIGTDLYSLQLYPAGFFDHFDPGAGFMKWAAVAVNNFDHIPPGMETFILPSGLYAVFHYKGVPGEAPAIFGYIFGTWLPTSDFLLDERPHFEILGKKFNMKSAASEEEIWIPVKPK